MPNQLLQQQVSALWLGIRGQKAAQIEQHLSQCRRKAWNILGENHIDSITHVSLLKLLAYQLVIFADSCSRSQEAVGGQRQLERMAEINGLMACFHESQDEAVLNIHKYRSLKRKLSALDDMLQQPSTKEHHNSMEGEGMDAMVEQLEKLLAKKERRIRELNGELEENFIDKEELEDEIELLQNHNQQLQEQLDELSTDQGQQGLIRELHMEIARLQGHTMALEEEQQSLRHKISDLESNKKADHQQERLLFGNISPKKTLEGAVDEVIMNQPLTHSSRLFAKKYTQGIPDTTPTTVRKTSRTVMEEWKPQEEEEENLLASDRSPFRPRRPSHSPEEDKARTSPRLSIKRQPSYQTESEQGQFWQRLLLCQAIAIEEHLYN